MTEKPLYKCWTKATDRESGDPRRSLNWVASRRAYFKIFQDRIECGDWKIPFSSVTRATAFKTRSMLVPCTVLQLKTGDRSFQFGFNPWASPTEKLPLKVEVQHVKLQHSPFSIVVRLLIVVWIVYLVLR